ncbi:MAG: hypothetical protein JNL79_11695 [Myxococcales bacterium]|nr:hypothetical protein [Myxococcales bacterium]
MKPFRVLPVLALASALAAASAAGFVGCSSETPKAGLGDKCEESAQCDTPRDLVCKCVRRKAADEEGPEQILALGTCQKADYKCPPADAGPIEVGPDVATDTGADVPTDGPSDAPTDAASEAGDGAADAAESSTDADPDGG